MSPLLAIMNLRKDVTVRSDHSSLLLALLIDRTVLQHERRLLNRSYQPYSNLHLVLLRDLFQLSTSHYSEVIHCRFESGTEIPFQFLLIQYTLYM